MQQRLTALLPTAALLLVLAGCASTQMNAEWSNPQFKGRSLKGQNVLVVCAAQDFTSQQLCEDQMAARMTAGGARVVRLPANDPSAGANNEALQAAAKRAGATAVSRTNLSVAAAVANPGPSFSIGIGGFGGGGGGGGYGAGGGVSAPIGGATTSLAYSAETTIIDASSGATIWSGRATTPTSNDLSAQLSDLSRVTTESMQKAGLI
ncbi:MAG: hypothetical protein ACREBN_05915 [Burkholderiaceae bacterium]